MQPGAFIIRDENGRIEFACAQVKTTRARKDHVCGDCGGPIHEGELYQRHEVWHGGWVSLLYCRACRWNDVPDTGPYDYLLLITDALCR